MEYENDTAWVRGMLYPGESLLWTGKPGKGHLFGKEDAFMIPFSIVWCSFAVFFEVGVIKANTPLFAKLWGIPFVLVGLYITVGRFIVKWIRGKRSRYALTSQRILAKVGNRIQKLELHNLPHVTVSQRADGTGDIRFGETGGYRRTASAFNFGFERTWSTSAVPELRNLPDVNQVEYRIRTAAEQAIRAMQSD